MTRAAATQQRAIAKVMAKTVIHMAHLHPGRFQRAYADLVSFSGTIRLVQKGTTLKIKRDQWLRKEGSTSGSDSTRQQHEAAN